MWMWLIMFWAIGDFNDILSASKKKGRTDRAPWLINGFRSAVSDARLLDVHVEGYLFTWFKSLGTERAVEERLDRALVNKQWFQLYPNVILENLPAPASDHSHILLTREPVSNNSRVISIFKFENVWLVDSDFHDYVHNRWHSYGHRDVIDKLDLCAKDFSDWNKNRCLHLRRDIDICRRKLDRTRTNVNPANVKYFNALRNRMTHLLVQDDAFWRQRSKICWLKDGDLNTRFFHAATTSRKKVNRIVSLVNSDGVRYTEPDDLCNIARNYFTDIFQKQNSPVTLVLEVINQSISDDDNALLTTPFT
ncbi:hypothetical protein TSUD_240620 [Trifolium subterraneum]|uniref:Endonuclease/exonuclease/phosphatase domain-containing protein n=1 Tax=Trifolium subterraneum TaxID=3900 RepID=A0A2Z6P236_TRISU|nr:hypothetical protein TSUD_240620 [Trifolium subterraneum]